MRGRKKDSSFRSDREWHFTEKIANPNWEGGRGEDETWGKIWTKKELHMGGNFLGPVGPASRHKSRRGPKKSVHCQVPGIFRSALWRATRPSCTQFLPNFPKKGGRLSRGWKENLNLLNASRRVNRPEGSPTRVTRGRVCQGCLFNGYWPLNGRKGGGGGH